MTIESERPRLSPEEKFTQGIVSRFDLWNSIIDESDASGDIKNNVKTALEKLKEGGLTRWASLDDAFYGTINHLVTLTESWKRKGEPAAVLFETLRDDLWDFHKEVTS